MKIGFVKTKGIIKLLPTILYHTKTHCDGKCILEIGWLIWSIVIVKETDEKPIGMNLSN